MNKYSVRLMAEVFADSEGEAIAIFKSFLAGRVEPLVSELEEKVFEIDS